MLSNSVNFIQICAAATRDVSNDREETEGPTLEPPGRLKACIQVLFRRVLFVRQSRLELDQQLHHRQQSPYVCVCLDLQPRSVLLQERTENHLQYNS